MTPEEREALRLAEEAEAQRLAQEAAATNSTMQPTDIIGQQGQQKTGMDTNPTQNGTLIGVPDFNEPYIYPEAARAFKGVEFNMPFNPLDPNPQISATIDEPVKNAQFSGTSGISYSPFGGLGTSSTTDTGQLRLNNLIDNIKDQNQRMAQSSYSPFGGMSTTSTALQNRSGFGGKVEDVAGRVLSNLSDEAIIGRLAAASGSVEPGSVEMATPESVEMATPELVEMATPELVSNLSVNGMDVVAPISSIEAVQSQAAPGSPQAIFEAIRAKGPLSPELIAAGKSRAEKIGTTFDPETGFSRDPFLQYQQSQNRPGYGYAGAANDQYRSADFDTISQGVFDTPMTGMRPINAETGEPLSQGVIDAAARAGLELPMGSVPLPKAPVNSVPMGRDATRARLGGMTLNQYLNAPDGAVSGLRTDPQGRMIPGRGREAQDGVFAYDDMTRADAYGQYEDEVSQAYQRQSERMQQRADQRDGTAGPRTYGGYTTSQLRGMVGGGDNLRAAQMRAEAGLNPVTGNRESTEEQNQLQTEVLKARLAQLKEQDPDKLSKAESYADRLNLQGDARTAFIFSQMGTAMDDVFGLEGTGAGGGGGRTFATEEEAIASGVKGKVTIGGRPAVI